MRHGAVHLEGTSARRPLFVKALGAALFQGLPLTAHSFRSIITATKAHGRPAADRGFELKQSASDCPKESDHGCSRLPKGRRGRESPWPVKLVTVWLPPAYLMTDTSPAPGLALEGYVELMSEWVEAATKGQPVDELIPVNVAPTPDSAKLLQTRLTFLGAEVVSLHS